METVLVEFIDTLESLLKLVQAEAGGGAEKLTISQYQYLDAIHTLGEPSITELASYLGITKASVTAGVNKLERLGYALKTQSNKDRRIYRVSLTEASQRLVEARDKALQEYGKFIRAALSAQEAQQLEAILQKLVDRFRQPRAEASRKAGGQPQ